MAKLQERSIIEVEYARKTFMVTPPAGTDLKDMLVHDYWAHVAYKLTPHDIIEIIPEDGAFYARLLVVNCQKLWAKVQVLEMHKIVDSSKVKVAPTDILEPKYTGPSGKWRVVSKKNGEQVSAESFQTQDDASSWIEAHGRELVA